MSYLPVKLLSYSAMSMFLECPRRFAFKYIDKAEPDEAPTSDWLIKGRALHECVEVGGTAPAENIQDVISRVHVRAGAKKVFDMKKLGQLPKTTRKEVKIINEEHSFIGYMDSELINDDNSWLIGEMKSTGSFDQTRFALMRVSHQLGLYVGMIAPYAHANFLSPKDFLGVHNTTVAFPGKLKMLKANKRNKRDETEEEFERRVFDKTQIYQQMLKPDDLEVKHSMHTFAWVKESIDHLGPRSDAYPKCTAQCKNAFGLCDFFSSCHGFRIDLGAEIESDIDTEDTP